MPSKTAYLSEELITELEKTAEEENSSQSQLIQEALKQYLFGDEENENLRVVVETQKKLINELKNRNKELKQKSEVDFEEIRERVSDRWNELSRFERLMFSIIYFLGDVEEIKKENKEEKR